MCAVYGVIVSFYRKLRTQTKNEDRERGLTKLKYVLSHIHPLVPVYIMSWQIKRHLTCKCVCVHECLYKRRYFTEAKSDFRVVKTVLLSEICSFSSRLVQIRIHKANIDKTLSTRPDKTVFESGSVL